MIFSNILNGSLVHSVINETTRADNSLLYGASICGKATSNVSCCLGFSSQSWSYPTTTKNIENKILNEYTFTGFVFIWLWLNSIWYKVTCMNVRKASYIRVKFWAIHSKIVFLPKDTCRTLLFSFYQRELHVKND